MQYTRRSIFHETLCGCYILGDSVWMLYSEKDFLGRRFMAKEGEWRNFFGFNCSTVMSVEKLGICYGYVKHTAILVVEQML